MGDVKKNDELILFEMAVPERKLASIQVSVAEFPGVLVVTEVLSDAMQLLALPDGVNLQLVRMPYNKSAYADSTPLFQFTNIQTERMLIRRVKPGEKLDLSQLAQYDLELVAVYSCTIEAL